MMLIRTRRGGHSSETQCEPRYQAAPPLDQGAPLELRAAPALEQTVHARYAAGPSQRAIAREFGIDRRTIEHTLGQAT